MVSMVNIKANITIKPAQFTDKLLKYPIEYLYSIPSFKPYTFYIMFPQDMIYTFNGDLKIIIEIRRIWVKEDTAVCNLVDVSVANQTVSFNSLTSACIMETEILTFPIWAL